MIDPDAPVVVVGATSLLGGALLRALARHGHRVVIPLPGDGSPLTAATDLDELFARSRPAWVFVASVRAGGIDANVRRPADLMVENLWADTLVITAAHRHRVRTLLYLASSCAYPRACSQPMHVKDLMTGPLEPTSEAYATAKLAGMTLCRAYRRQYGDDFVTAIPADSYGPGDDFSEDGAHVVAALLRRLHEAKTAGAPAVTVWGTGDARRELVFADDLAEACLFVMSRYAGEAPINLGGGTDRSIREVAELIREVVGYTGALEFDTSRPDGMPRKALDASAVRALGWAPSIDLRAGLDATYEWFLRHVATIPAGTGGDA